MEHMEQEWWTEYGRGKWQVYSLDYHLFEVTGFMAGDQSGEKTARAICAEHNAALAARKANNQTKDV